MIKQSPRAHVSPLSARALPGICEQQLAISPSSTTHTHTHSHSITHDNSAAQQPTILLLFLLWQKRIVQFQCSRLVHVISALIHCKRSLSAPSDQSATSDFLHFLKYQHYFARWIITSPLTPKKTWARACFFFFSSWLPEEVSTRNLKLTNNYI